MADNDSTENAGPRKGLWALMGQKRDEPRQSVAPSETPSETTPESALDQAADVPAEAIEESATNTTTTPLGRPKGLWSLMQQADPASIDAEESISESEPALAQESGPPESRAAFEGPIKGADKRLRQLQRVVETATDAEQFQDEVLEPDIDVLPEAVSASNQRQGARVTTDWIAPTPTPVIAPAGTSRSAFWSLILGGLSVPISLVAILPETWARIPPSLLGFVALIFGFLAISEINRSRQRLRGSTLAYSGLLLGLLGMFAGPMIYTPLNLYGRLCDWHTGDHLKQIGAATETYYQAYSAYPPGGIFQEAKQGQFEPLHGWMTQVLPHLPEGAALASQIDLGKPYFDPVNLGVMGQQIPSFLAAGGSQDLIQEKFAPAHFAGLGGSLMLEDGATGHVGIFDLNSELTRDDILDGLSNTMLVGELGHGYPAWGEPNNWRQIGKGLNRDPNGFGNARHSGAMFLMADGSVKFFPNQTDPKVLQSLSTRDGGEGF